MLCSECSNEVKPIVAFDIDGTLGDYHIHILDFAEKYMGVDMEAKPAWRINPYRGGQNFGDWFCDMYRVSRKVYREIKLAYRQGGYKRWMPMFPGARETVNLFYGSCEIWLTTTRPYLRLDSVDPDTRFWLQQNQILFHHLLYDDDKYGRLAEIVDPERVITIVEDLPKLYKRADEVFGPEVPLLQRTRWNESADYKNNSSPSMETTRQIITKRVQNWRIAHAQLTGA